MRLLGVGYLSVGVILGVLVASAIILFLPDRRPNHILSLNISNPEVLASILGALVGGVVTAFTAQATFEKATIREMSRDAAERDARRKAQAYTLLLKLVQALDRVQKAHNYYRTFDRASIVEIIRQDATGDHTDKPVFIWQPLQGKRSGVEIENSEKAFLLEEGSIDFFNLISDLQGALSNCDFIEGKYNEFFWSFLDGRLEAGNTRVHGRLINAQSEPDEYGLLKTVDALDKLRAALTSVQPRSYKSVQMAISLIERKFGERVSMEFDISIDGVADYAR